MMYRLLFILSTGFIFAHSALSQSSVWKVEGNGNTIYLGGTIHMLTPEDYPLPGIFDSAYAWSDILVLEADLNKMEDPEVIQRMMTLAMYQDDRTLKSELSEEVYHLLEEECSKIDLELVSLMKFKPSMVLLIYTVTKMQQSGSISEGVDQFYLSRAQSDEKDLLFLETVDSQLKLLFEDEDEDNDQGVLHFFDDMEKWETQLIELKAGWRNGSSKMFRETQKEMRKKYPEVYQKMLTDRNEAWVSTFDSYLKTGPTEFVLAGALHMHGSDGLLGMLKKKGYKISQPGR